MGTVSPLETKIVIRTDGQTVAYTKAEWFEVAKERHPGITPEQYDRMWDDFCAAKAAHLREMNA